MSRQCICVVIIIAVSIISVFAQIINNERCGIQSFDNQHPWLVGLESVYLNSPKTLCSGILITNRHVVAKTICLAFHGGPRTVRLGGAYCTGKNCGEGISIPIKEVIVHPEHTNAIDSPYNIALIVLRDMVSYSDTVRPICLPTSDITQLAAAKKLYHIGLTYSFPIKLRQLIATFREKSECQSLKPIKENMICAKTSGSNICFLPGSALINEKGDSYELLGLIEEGDCASERIYDKFFPYLDWIQSKMPELTFEYRIANSTEQTVIDVSTPPSENKIILSGNGASEILGRCGRRKVNHVELIVNGESTKAGDWPWHVAIYRIDGSNIKYICGGTLISKITVLTAAHCATILGVPVNPEILSVVLGKYNLIGGDLQSQERQVHTVIVHENFAPKNLLENDIALLKLRTEATFNNHVQPACLWSRDATERLPSNRDLGTVVGWGIDQSEELSLQLKQANLPKVPDVTCIKKNPIFYSQALDNNKKFCAGWANGTSACNGDSGGGYLVFVPDSAKADSTDAMGAWYIRGIVSLSAALKNRARCDPNQYVIFTDVDKYTNWIQTHLEN